MKCLLLFLLNFLWLSSYAAQASVIYVSGDVSGSWMADTVIVTAEIRVPPGQALSIAPGTAVLFQTFCKFIIDNASTLTAIGISTDSIHFDVLTPGTTWRGLRFLSANPASQLQYCYLAHGEAAGTSPDNKGGAIYCYHTDLTISHNTISQNSALHGGGIYCYHSSPTMQGNFFAANEAHHGGAIMCADSSDAAIIGNTILANASVDGGAIYCADHSSPIALNNIFWANSPQQIYADSLSQLSATYCDVQGGWPGSGNIDQYPAFVDSIQHDYRLQWGSPCIDSGDPNPIYNDPDGTRADMGAFYFDQSGPVCIMLTPHNAPIVVPAGGGSFDFTIQGTNIENVAHRVTIWCNVTLPNGSIYGPVLGPVTVTLAPNFTLSRVRTQAVPAAAPAGAYSYNAYAAVGPDTSQDSFAFAKSGAGRGSQAADDWKNSGQAFAQNEDRVSLYPSAFSLSCYPNPFNPATVLSFELPEASFVKLQVFDLFGRDVGARHASPSNGVGFGESDLQYFPAGAHKISFDGSNLPSGIYLYRLAAGQLTASSKMLLIK